MTMKEAIKTAYLEFGMSEQEITKRMEFSDREVPMADKEINPGDERKWIDYVKRCVALFAVAPEVGETMKQFYNKRNHSN